MPAFGLLALIGLLFSVAVHLSTFTEFGWKTTFPVLMVMHLGIFVVLVPAVWYLRHDQSQNILKTLPAGRRPLMLLMLTYATINLLLNVFQLPSGGSVSIGNGTYILHQSGLLPHVADTSEYYTFQRSTLRLFSGYWMLFYLFPALLFLRRKEGDLQETSVYY